MRSGSLLIPEKNWVGLDEINTEPKILNHKLFDDAFEEILKQYTPKKDMVLLSLCTKTRPYSKSTKWKYLSKFRTYCDLVVVSSGGIIPEPFWGQYPFYEYDGLDKDGDELYCQKMEYRLTTFLNKFQYKYVVANFRPNLRNTNVAHKVLENLKNNNIIEDYVVVPSIDEYKKIQENGFVRGKPNPDIDPIVLNKIISFIGDHKKLKENNYF